MWCDQPTTCYKVVYGGKSRGLTGGRRPHEEKHGGDYRQRRFGENGSHCSSDRRSQNRQTSFKRVFSALQLIWSEYTLCDKQGPAQPVGLVAVEKEVKGPCSIRVFHLQRSHSWVSRKSTGASHHPQRLGGQTDPVLTSWSLNCRVPPSQESLL